MFIADMLVAFVFGFIFVWVVSSFFGFKGPWNSFLLFFLVVGLFAWAGGIWLVPFGPRYMGIGWLPILFMAFLAVLFFLAVSPRKTTTIMASKEETESSKETYLAIDFFFWLFIICLVIFGTCHYFWYPRVS
jgi:hypothetical protein